MPNNPFKRTRAQTPRETKRQKERERQNRTEAAANKSTNGAHPPVPPADHGSVSRQITGRDNERIILGGMIGFGFMNPGDAPGLIAKSGFLRIVERSGAVSVCMMKFDTYFGLLENAYKNALAEKIRMAENENSDGNSNGDQSGTEQDSASDRVESSDPGI